MTPEEVAAWVAESRVAQGLPEQVTDPAGAAQIAALVGPVIREQAEERAS